MSILKSRIVDLNEEKLSKVEGNAKYKLLKTLEAEFEATQLKYDQLFNRWSKVNHHILNPIPDISLSTYLNLDIFIQKIKE